MSGYIGETPKKMRRGWIEITNPNDIIKYQTVTEEVYSKLPEGVVEPWDNMFEFSQDHYNAYGRKDGTTYTWNSLLEYSVYLKYKDEDRYFEVHPGEGNELTILLPNTYSDVMENDGWYSMTEVTSEKYHPHYGTLRKVIRKAWVGDDDGNPREVLTSKKNTFFLHNYADASIDKTFVDLYVDQYRIAAIGKGVKYIDYDSSYYNLGWIDTIIYSSGLGTSKKYAKRSVPTLLTGNYGIISLTYNSSSNTTKVGSITGPVYGQMRISAIGPQISGDYTSDSVFLLGRDLPRTSSPEADYGSLYLIKGTQFKYYRLKDGGSTWVSGPSLGSDVVLKQGYATAGQPVKTRYYPSTLDGYIYVCIKHAIWQLCATLNSSTYSYSWSFVGSSNEINFVNDNDTVIYHNKVLFFFSEGSKTFKVYDGSAILFDEHSLPVYFTKTARVFLSGSNDSDPLYLWVDGVVYVMIEEVIMAHYSEYHWVPFINFDPSNFYGLPFYLKKTSALLINDNLHLVGGSNDTHCKFYYYDGTEWSKLSDTILGYETFSNNFYMSNVILHDGKLIFVSANNTYGLEIWSNNYPTDGTNVWVKDQYSYASLGYRLYNSCVVSYNDKIYILGGGPRYNYFHSYSDNDGLVKESDLEFNTHYNLSVVCKNKIYSLDSKARKLYSYDGTSWEFVSDLIDEIKYDTNSYDIQLFEYEGAIHVIYNDNTNNNIVGNYYYDDHNNRWVKVNMEINNVVYPSGEPAQFIEYSKTSIFKISDSTLYFDNFLYIMIHTYIIELNVDGLFE